MESKTRIKGNVHYVGVNDRNKHRFEAMWPLPHGVSYNSYLIDDEMVALAFGRQFFFQKINLFIT